MSKSRALVLLLALRNGVNRAAHADERAAAADVGDGGVYLLVARIGPLGEQCRDGHDHAGLAVPALRHLVVYPGLLNLVQLAVPLQALDGRDRHSLDRRDRQRAGPDCPTVQVHGAGAIHKS